MGDLGFPGAVVRATDAAFQRGDRRGAGGRPQHHDVDEGGRASPSPSSRIAPCRSSDLADYTSRLTEVLDRHGVTRHLVRPCLGAGCLHVRPVLNRRRIRSRCAEDARHRRGGASSAGAASTSGSHSGEHGDGIVRSEFHEAMFGPRIARAFRGGEGRLRSALPGAARRAVQPPPIVRRAADG